MDIKSVAQSITAVMAVVSITFGAYFYIDGSFVRNEAHAALVKKVSLVEIIGQYMEARRELFFLKAQLRKYPTDEDLKEAVKDAQAIVDDLKKQYTDLKKEKSND